MTFGRRFQLTKVYLFQVSRNTCNQISSNLFVFNFLRSENSNDIKASNNLTFLDQYRVFDNSNSQVLNIQKNLEELKAHLQHQNPINGPPTFNITANQVNIQNNNSDCQKNTSDFIQKFDLHKNESSHNNQYGVSAPIVAVDSIYELNQGQKNKNCLKNLTQSLDQANNKPISKEVIPQDVEESQLHNKFHVNLMASLAKSSNLSNPWICNNKKGEAPFFNESSVSNNIDHKNALTKRMPADPVNRGLLGANVLINKSIKKIKTDATRSDNFDAIFKNLEEVYKNSSLKNSSK